MIIRSAWRGEGRNTSAPNRATSNRAAAIDIISIAQHAKPNPSGQIELFRAQFTALSSVVKMIPSSSSSLPKSSGFVSVTCLPSDVLIVPRSPFSHTLTLETICAFRGTAILAVRAFCGPQARVPLYNRPHWLDLLPVLFFFQAEDGIRDHCVTGVQTCALPI